MTIKENLSQRPQIPAKGSVGEGYNILQILMVPIDFWDGAIDKYTTANDVLKLSKWV